MDEGLNKQQLNLKNTENIQTGFDLRPVEEQMKALRKKLMEARKGGIKDNDFVDSLSFQEKEILDLITKEDTEYDQPPYDTYRKRKS